MSDPAYCCLPSSEALPVSWHILWLSRQSVGARHFQPNPELSMPHDFTFNRASVLQKEVECSGEATRDMANDNATVFENGNSVSVFFISLLYFCLTIWVRWQFEGGNNKTQIHEASSNYLSAWLFEGGVWSRKYGIHCSVLKLYSTSQVMASITATVLSE